MGSRRRLWGFLMLGALPLLLEATTGCDVFFGLDRIENPDHNGLYCECTCEAKDARLPRIMADADDAEENASSMAVDTGSGDLDLGAEIVGLRFSGLGIPQGTEIAHAYVQFEGDVDGESDPANYTVRAEASVSPAPFTATAGNISGRNFAGLFEASSSWGTWNNGDASTDQKTVDLADLLQELVDDPNWDENSAIVFRFTGTGQRSAESHDGSSGSAAQLIVDLGVAAVLPVCASGPNVAWDANGHIPNSVLDDECNEVAATLTGLAGSCGYPTPCSCSRVDRKSELTDQPDSIYSSVCDDTCPSVPADAPACDNFNPNAYVDCLATGTPATCKQHVSATHVDGIGDPVCVHSGSALAFHAFGERSLCEVAGEADIAIGDRRPKDPATTIGRVELLGEPCPGGSCPVQPFLDLLMDPIEFEVRWASNPVFRNLNASARGLETALAEDTTGEASFVTDTVRGTGAGRRGSKALAIDAANPDPLDIGIDWAGRVCDVVGTLATGVGDDGVCEADGTTPCATDDDCAAVGGACTLPPEVDEMLVGLNLAGTLVNQPPSANAGADQTVECTSSAGASFTLDGTGTSDPDGNLALSRWHAGTRTGPVLGTTPTVVQALGVGGAESYVLRVVDTLAQTDEDTTSAVVVDTTPPVIACNAPATIRPPDAVIAFGATATDVCDAEVAAQVFGYDCFTFTKKGRRVSKLESCVVSFESNTLTIADVGGYGDIIQWFVGAVDDSGNMQQVTCEVKIQ